VEFATGLPVFIDGRNEVIGPAFFADYQRMQDVDGFARALQRWQPQIVLVPFNQVAAWFFTSTRTEARWRCVYADEQSAVFLRNDFATEVPAAGPLPYPRLTDAETDRILAEARRPRGFRPGASSRAARLPAGRHAVDDAGAAAREDAGRVAHGLEGVRRATVPVPDLWHNLALAFLRLGDREARGLCYDAVPPERRDPRIGDALRQNASRRRMGTTSLAASQ
jgi:hypothetical protein